MNYTGYPFDVSLASSSEVLGGVQTLRPVMTLDQEHSSFLAPPPPFSGTGSTFLDLAPSTTLQPAGDLASLPGSSLAARPFVDLSDPPNPPTLSHTNGEKLTRRGKPKPKEKDLDPAEDIPTTAANARMGCGWGSCTKEFRAGDWTAHVRTGNHRAEMLATRDKTAHVKCLWEGCRARLQPGSMSKHVRALHIGTYEFRCKQCGATARGDSYVGTHGRARDCPMRPGSSQPSPATPSSVRTSPALSSSSASSLSSRHLRRFSPYCRSTTSSEVSEGSDERAQQVFRLIAKVLSRRRHPLAQGTSSRPPVAGRSTEASPVGNLPILAPRPIRPVRLDAFERFLSQPSNVVPDVPEIAPPLPNPEPLSPTGHESPPLCGPLAMAPDVSTADLSLFSLIEGTTHFNTSFGFGPDATS